MAPRLKPSFRKSFKNMFFMITCTLILLKTSFFLISPLSSPSKLLTIHLHDHDHENDDVDHSDFRTQSTLESSSSSHPDDHIEQTLESSNTFSAGANINTHISAKPLDDALWVPQQEEKQPAPATTTNNSMAELPVDEGEEGDWLEDNSGPPWNRDGGQDLMVNISRVVVQKEGQLSVGGPKRSHGKHVHDKEVFHDRDIFMEDYNQMNRSFKIYIYPHRKDDPFANVLLPVNYEPGGNYASESYFKIALSKSHFVTKDPSKADLFFLPFSIACMRHDKRIGVGGIQDFVRDYISTISHKYPYWNRTGGADHFYVACHSIGKIAMEKAPEVRINAIQVVCSSNYFLQGYTAHKDASIPQIWPRQGDPPNHAPSKRRKLAFYAGAMNSKVRETLVQTWGHDSEISVHRNRIKTPYSESLLGSKFCIHAKGFEVNTARIGDAIYYGCVPVILADHYDLPFADVLNWSCFSVVLSTQDIPSLKRILKEIVDSGEYLKLQKNVLEVRNHFQWHQLPVNFDAFYMIMYELWRRRSSIRIHSFNSFSSGTL